MDIFIYVLGSLFFIFYSLVLGTLSCAIWDFTKPSLVKKFPFLANYLKSSPEIELKNNGKDLEEEN